MRLCVSEDFFFFPPMATWGGHRLDRNLEVWTVEEITGRKKENEVQKEKKKKKKKEGKEGKILSNSAGLSSDLSLS